MKYLCFEQKYEKISEFLSENFQFLEVKFSIYLNRRVVVMSLRCPPEDTLDPCLPTECPAKIGVFAGCISNFLGSVVPRFNCKSFLNERTVSGNSIVLFNCMHIYDNIVNLFLRL